MIERLASRRLAAARAAAGQNDYPEYDDFDYMVTVLAAAQECGIDELSDEAIPSRSWENCTARCQDFRDNASRVSQRLMMRHAGNYDPNTVAFDNKTKEKLRFHLNQLRVVVKKDAMPDWQKQEWYDAISELEAQIDKTRTALGAFLNVAGKGLSGSMPVAEAVDRVVAIVKEAKLVEAARAALNAPVAPKQIEGPKPKQLPAPKAKKNGFDKALDDEIPF
ncbi:MAG: hypothetical protein ABL907_12375 [Hyphomicrobium sp.]